MFTTLPADPSKAEQIRTEVQVLLQKQAVQVVQDQSSPGYYSRIFLVQKKNGKWRCIIDLSQLNLMILVRRFKMETVASLRNAVQPNDYAVSVDLQDAYFHVPVHKSSQKYLRFALEGVVYQFVCLPFGLSSSPQIFTMVMDVVMMHQRLQSGAYSSAYLDDILLKERNKVLLLRALSCFRLLTVKLGLLINLEKSLLVPSQDFNHVGMHFLTRLNLVKLPDDRADKLIKCVRNFLRLPSPTARDFLILLGTLNAAADLVVLGRLRMRPIQFHLLARWRPKVFPLDHPVPVTVDIREACTPWLNRRWLTDGVPISHPQAQLVLMTDASLQGWGAVLLPQKAEASGHWNNSEIDLHINILELKAVFLSLKSFLPFVRHKHAMLWTDNTTVAAYIRKQGGTKSPYMTVIIWNLLWWCRENNVLLSVTHISSALNVRADILSRSRQLASTEWSLHPSVFKQINLLYGDLNIDLFATDLNHKLPVYVSPCPDPSAWAVDALSIRWTGMAAYAFPPFPLIPKVLLKVKEDKAQVVLVAPWWPQRSWTSLLLDLVHDFPRVMPLWPNLLKQPRRDRFHEAIGSLHLHVWPLSGRPSDVLNFQRRCLNVLPTLDGNLPPGCIMLSGRASFNGPKTMVMCRPKPLFRS